MIGAIIILILIISFILGFLSIFEIRFLCTPLKIVKWEDGTYSLQSKYLAMYPRYLSANGYWWITTYEIENFCKFRNIETARKTKELFEKKPTIVE